MGFMGTLAHPTWWQDIGVGGDGAVIFFAFSEFVFKILGVMDDLEAVRDLDSTEVQRRFRLMEDDRKAYLETSNNVLRLQRSMLTRLESEKTALETELRIISSPENVRKSFEQLETLADLLAQYETHNEMIRRAEFKMDKLKHSTIMVEDELKAQKALIGGELINKKKRADMTRRVSALEDRVEHATRQLNAQLSRNSSLRKEIENLMRERGSHCRLTKRLTNRLARGSKELQTVVNQVSQIYDQRDEIETRLRSLKQVETEEARNSSSEIQHLRRILTEQTRLEKFLGQKSAPRLPSVPHRSPPSPAVPFLAATAATTLKKEGQPRTSENREPGATDDQKWAGRSIGFSDLTAAGKLLHELVGLVTVSGEGAVGGIDPTGNPEQLISWFVKREEENMALYSYINELSNATSEIEDSIEDLQKESKQLKARGSLAQNGREEERHEMEVRVMKAKVETEAVWQQFEGIDLLLSAILTKIRDLYTTANSFGLPLIDVLGGKTEVTSSNAMIYVGAVEKRVIELLQARRMITGTPAANTPFFEHQQAVGGDLLGPSPTPPPSLGSRAKDGVQKNKFMPPEIREEEPLMTPVDVPSRSADMFSHSHVGLPTDREEVVILIRRSTSPAISEPVIRSRSRASTSRMV